MKQILAVGKVTNKHRPHRLKEITYAINRNVVTDVAVVALVPSKPPA